VPASTFNQEFGFAHIDLRKLVLFSLLITHQPDALLKIKEVLKVCDCALLCTAVLK